MTDLPESFSPSNSPEQEKEFAELPVRILRLKQVVERTGLSRSTIYDRIDPKSRRYDATFPKCKWRSKVEPLGAFMK